MYTEKKPFKIFKYCQEMYIQTSWIILNRGKRIYRCQSTLVVFLVTDIYSMHILLSIFPITKLGQCD